MTWLPHTFSHFPRAFATCFREVLPSTLLATGAVGADSRLASQVQTMAKRPIERPHWMSFVR